MNFIKALMLKNIKQINSESGVISDIMVSTFHAGYK